VRDTEIDNSLLEVARTFRPGFWQDATASRHHVDYRKISRRVCRMCLCLPAPLASRETS